jgi:hypothetical protein
MAAWTVQRVNLFRQFISRRVVYEASQPSGVVTLAFEKDGDLTPCPWKWENVDSHGTVSVRVLVQVSENWNQSRQVD